MAEKTKITLKAITPKHLRIIDDNKLRFNLQYNMHTYLERVRAIMQANYDTTVQPTYYKRTFKLQHGWHIVEPVTAEQGTLINETPYSAFVQGPNRLRESGDLSFDVQKAGQSRALRARGWKSISDVARDTKKIYKTVMNRAITGSVID